MDPDEIRDVRKLAWVWPVLPCKWCGRAPKDIGVFMDLESRQVMVAYSCPIHNEYLVELIDGLTDGRLAEANALLAEQRKETFN